MPDPTPAVSAAIECELRFLDPAVHTSPALLGELLHPDFASFGSSGRAWNRETLVKELRARGPASAPATVSELTAVQLAPDVVHVTFDVDVNGRRAHRSSVWRLTGGDWLLYFHQGTAFTPEEVPPQD
ncbi:nuclear transport factor 2 family protein [Streptomyces montanisoli]|uniref:Nuclear transport factor 2 family protein n=1 Tax=Streptomyces montanisoli TaxID=2798581 RepID=A0A940MMF2_9ACTN|nr:nuclear transport factor 2 family protein [Streptomyces montanisoli]MBP0462121.1 nuclear transport factor 2 family protein [Streptomyces montanisoli]